MKLCCAALHVARPGYYRWLCTKDRPHRCDAVLSELKKIREEHKTIGVWQMHRRLTQTHASYGTVYRLLRENDLMARRKPRSITKGNTNAEAAEDLA